MGLFSCARWRGLMRLRNILFLEILLAVDLANVETSAIGVICITSMADMERFRLHLSTGSSDARAFSCPSPSGDGSRQHHPCPLVQQPASSS
jgi:hypothetical protein